MRSYSTVASGDAPGVGNARSRLDSDQAWSAADGDSAAPWMQMDLGEVMSVDGVITQGRKFRKEEWVTKFTVETSSDGSAFTSVKGVTFERTPKGWFCQPGNVAAAITFENGTIAGFSRDGKEPF